MATLTFNGATDGVAQAVTLKAPALSQQQVVEVFFNPTGVYDQAATESVEVTNVDTLIQNSRRNGKTVTLRSACGGQSARAADGNEYACRTVVVSGTKLQITLFIVGGAEASNGALPAFLQPLSALVAIEES